MRVSFLFCVVLAAVGCRTTARETRPYIMQPHEGDYLWVFPESKDELGSGGELQIFVDAHTHPHARASFAKFTLGVGGALPVHRHDKTEEFSYFLSGEGAAVALDDDGTEIEIPVSVGYVWYNPPGVWHAVRNTGSTPLSLVFATVPNEKKGLLTFFRRICAEPGQEGIPLSHEELERIGSEHDVIFRAGPDSHGH